MNKKNLQKSWDNDKFHLTFTGHNFKACQEFIGEAYDNTLNYPNIITKDGIQAVMPYDQICKDEYGDLSLNKK